MGAPAHLVVPDSSQKSALSSPGASPTETATSSSPSFTDSFSSSFTQSSGPDVVPASTEENQKKHVLEEKVGYGMHKNIAAEVKRIKKSKGPLRESKRALMGSRQNCNVGGATRKACCRCAGAFAADCAALCCCPCAIFSLVSFVLIDLPSALARKLMNNLKCIKEPPTACSSRNGDNSISIFTPTWSYKEPCEGLKDRREAVSIIRFDTQNLLKHFEVEHFGFGCLSQKRD